jgi:CheY-like chemotaxis protein
MGALRILVVEDDAMIAMLLEELLSMMGHQVCAIATTGDEAVQAARKHRPDLMVVDDRLGSGSGPEAMDEILKDVYVPHMFVTGNALRVSLAIPWAVVISKPFHESDLVRGIADAMSAERRRLVLARGA